MVTFQFEMTYNDMVFRDAIVLPDDHGLTDAEIEAMKQKRFKDWQAVINAATEEPQE